jgi:poly(3-hydroxybutyrate) depolymerase
LPLGSQTVDGGYGWNIDDPSGTDEVDFVHVMMEAVSTEYSVPSTVPRIAQGFSNGAGLVLLLSCHLSTNLWVAHVAGYIHSNSDYPSSCSREASPCAEWNAIGEKDFFIASLKPTPRQGVLNQFEALRDTVGCSAEVATVGTETGYSCYAYPSCTAVGKLCVYDGLGHELDVTMAGEAWTYLTSSHGAAGCAAAGTP